MHNEDSSMPGGPMGHGPMMGGWHHKGWGMKRHAASGFYFLGFVGALVYFLQTASGGGAVLAGILKAIVWPAFLVHGLLKFLGM